MISCQAYDYVEIACMHRLRVRAYLYDSTIVEGTALDTARADTGEEVLVVEHIKGTLKLALHNIDELESLTSNPYFARIKFAEM